MNNTAAGLDQTLTEESGAQNSTLIIIDEVGEDSYEKRKRAREVVMVSRETATSEGNTVSLRGTADQKGRKYKRKCALACASVHHILISPEDIARFIIFDLQGKGKIDRAEKWHNASKKNF